MVHFAILGLLAVGLGGCALAPGGMSAAQMAAMSKLKDAGTVCVTATSPWGKGVVSYTLVDKSIAAVITIKDDCTTTVETKGLQKAP
ncbi:MAG: hypothetical protein Q8R92_20725 [Deltaproteobacteria bacterium]|nr:hypothetical protein [Deltaproteobacteria bacterium]